MSERSGDLTPGDPLGGPPSERPSDGLWAGSPGYTSPAPPGAGGPQPMVARSLGAQPVLSGWWRRVGAQAIDGLIIAVGALIVFALLAAAGGCARARRRSCWPWWPRVRRAPWWPLNTDAYGGVAAPRCRPTPTSR